MKCSLTGLDRDRRPLPRGLRAHLSLVTAHEQGGQYVGWKNLILHFPRLTEEQVFFHYNLSLIRYQSHTEIDEIMLNQVSALKSFPCRGGHGIMLDKHSVVSSNKVGGVPSESVCVAERDGDRDWRFI